MTTYPKNTPCVTIIILNWNGKNDTLDCLTSVSELKYKNYNIVVVDNGSIDNSVQEIKKQFPNIILIETGENLGYAGGNNVGIHYALQQKTDYIFLLNNDTVLDPYLLEHFIETDKKHPRGAILGPKIYFFDDPNRIWFAGAKWLPDKMHFIHLGSWEIDGPEFNAIVETDYITGCALFARADTFRSVGFLDETFFLTYEETDWCYRAKESGYQCYFVPKAKVWHKVSSSFGGNHSPLRNYFMVRNKMLWAKKHLNLKYQLKFHVEALTTVFNTIFPKFNFSINREIPAINNLFWEVRTWLKALKRNLSSPYNISIMLGYRDYYLGRFGNCPKKIRSLSETVHS